MGFGLVKMGFNFLREPFEASRRQSRGTRVPDHAPVGGSVNRIKITQLAIYRFLLGAISAIWGWDSGSGTGGLESMVITPPVFSSANYNFMR